LVPKTLADGTPVLNKNGKPVMIKLNNLFELNEDVGKWLARWREYQVGTLPGDSGIPIIAQKGMKTLSRHVVGSTMTYNIASYLNQTGALVQAGVELGLKYLTQGVYDVIRSSRKGNKLWEEMMELSNEMPGRLGQFDATISEAMTGKSLTGKYAQVQRAAMKPGMYPLSITDLVTAAATWFGAFRQGLAKFGKDARKEAARYADDVVERTQASAAKSIRAPIQRSALGAFVTTLQTFTLNHWDLISRDILGYKNPKIKTKERMLKAWRLFVGMSVLGYVWEDLIGIYSPMPNPVGTIRKALDNGEIDLGLAKELLLEATEVLPLVGALPKFRSAIGGPVVDAIHDILTGGTRAMLEAAARLAGAPGVSQAKKSYRAYLEDRRPLDVVTGGMSEGKKKSKKPVF
jgi:hypothetical protein